MRLYFDQDNGNVSQEEQNRTHVPIIELKRAAVPLEVTFTSAAIAKLLEGTAPQVKFVVKVKGQYDSTPLAQVTGFAAPAGGQFNYSAVIQLDTLPVRQAMFVDGNPTNDIAKVNAMAEILYRPDADADWVPSRTIDVELVNRVAGEGDFDPAPSAQMAFYQQLMPGATGRNQKFGINFKSVAGDINDETGSDSMGYTMANGFDLDLVPEGKQIFFNQNGQVTAPLWIPSRENLPPGPLRLNFHEFGHEGIYFWGHRGRFIPAGYYYFKATWKKLGAYKSRAVFEGPVITTHACTPDEPVDFPFPPLGETWMISDSYHELKTDYPYNVSKAEELVIRAVVGNDALVKERWRILNFVTIPMEVTAEIAALNAINPGMVSGGFLRNALETRVPGTPLASARHVVPRYRDVSP